MKNYLLFFILFAFLSFSSSGFAQMETSDLQNETPYIAGLTIYPNPVSNGKLYISTKNNLTKAIEIYDVLGKKILTTSLFGKELDVSKLTPGVYILKIKENNTSATRKLVVR